MHHQQILNVLLIPLGWEQHWELLLFNLHERIHALSAEWLFTLTSAGISYPGFQKKKSTNRKLMRYKPGYEWTKEKILLKLFPALLWSNTCLLRPHLNPPLFFRQCFIVPRDFLHFSNQFPLCAFPLKFPTVTAPPGAIMLKTAA